MNEIIYYYNKIHLIMTKARFFWQKSGCTYDGDGAPYRGPNYDMPARKNIGSGQGSGSGLPGIRIRNPDCEALIKSMETMGKTFTSRPWQRAGIHRYIENVKINIVVHIILGKNMQQKIRVQISKEKIFKSGSSSGSNHDKDTDVKIIWIRILKKHISVHIFL